MKLSLKKMEPSLHACAQSTERLSGDRNAIQREHEDSFLIADGGKLLN